jgi:hypothetical protein
LVSIVKYNNIQLLHLNEINMRFYGAEYNNIERGECRESARSTNDLFEIGALCHVEPITSYFPQHVEPITSYFPHISSV